MQNYFNYFTEIEEHFQRRRGALLLLSTLDWATAGFSLADKRKLFRENAVRAYRLDA